MNGLGLLTPTELLTSQIQSVVGEFLISKSMLVKLVNTKGPDIVAEANKLLAYHSILQNELEITLVIIENVKKGAYTMSDIITATATMWALNDHNKSVRSLVDKAGGVSLGLDIPWSTLLWVGVAGVGVYLVFGRK